MTIEVPSSLCVYVYCEGRSVFHFVYPLRSESDVTDMYNPFPLPVFAVQEVNVREEKVGLLVFRWLPASIYIPPPHPCGAEHEVNVREEREMEGVEEDGSVR